MKIIPALPNGQVLKIATHYGIIGGTIWPAAFALCQHLLTEQQQTLLSHKYELDCVELGSGTGAVGIFASGLGFRRTILTEHKPPAAAVIPSVPYNADGTIDFGLIGDEETQQSRKSDRLLDLLRENVKSNQDVLGDRLPKVMELDWTDPQHVQDVALASQSSDGFDLILASDVTYASEVHDCLAEVIVQLLRKPSSKSILASRCLLAHQERVLNLRGHDMQLLSFENEARNAGLEVYRRHNTEISNEADKKASISILELRHRSSMFDSEGSCLFR